MYVRKWVNHRMDGTTCIYVGIVSSFRRGNKVYQESVCRLGRLDQLQEKGRLDKLIEGLARFSQRRWIIADEISTGGTAQK
jgi:hypothetical protein